MSVRGAYEELIRRAREESVLASCIDLLGWDEETYMPRGGVANRADQLALLAGIQHEKATDPRIGELLAYLEGSSLAASPQEPTAVNIRELRRVYNRLTRLPRTLVEERARLTSLAQQEWASARQDADFARFRPWLEKVVRIKRGEAECLGYQDCPYDALLDEYEPGVRGGELAGLFDSLRRELGPLAAVITSSGRMTSAGLLHREYPIDRQRFLGETVAAAVGFDFDRGRLDTTTHPFFSNIGPGDCRITARFSTHNFSDAFFCILHEVGHGLYEQGLDPAHQGTPMGQAPSLGVHESQARLWENAVGRSRAFWEYFFPRARQVFHEALCDVALDDFYRAVNQVAPSFIRVQADEVTYNLHILLRFELERALITGDLRPADLPGAWDDAFMAHLGICPPNDREGCLQDGHWASGLIGYFPTYTLGNVFAAQLFAKAEKDIGDLDRQFARGDFSGVLAWLRDNVHIQGHRFAARKLIEHATGIPPGHRPLVEGLRRKYAELCGI
jgi:carboxypeptidase Taq